MSEQEQQPQEGAAGADGAAREHEPVPIDGPRIWVGSLANYNNGVLHGEWLDAARDTEELGADVRAMLARSKQPDAEEWGIFDYENFGSLRLGEYEGLGSIARLARGIAEHGLAFAAWAELHDRDPAALDGFQDGYLGEFESREAWAQSIVDDFEVEESIAKGVPPLIASHIRVDLAGIARDLEISGDVNFEDTPNGGVWVFDGRI